MIDKCKECILKNSLNKRLSSETGNKCSKFRFTDSILIEKSLFLCKIINRYEGITIKNTYRPTQSCRDNRRLFLSATSFNCYTNKIQLHIPEPVKIVGLIHGLLFILYFTAVIHVTVLNQWPLKRVLIAFAASIISFGPFLLQD